MILVRADPLWILAFLQLLINGSLSSGFKGFLSCHNTCLCSQDKSGNVFVKCSISRGNHTTKDLHLPKDVYSLDLSGNNLSDAPVYLDFKKHPNIFELSLKGNSIKEVKSSSFAGLNRLKNLNLALNDIRVWTGNQSRDTPELEYLDITGTIDWVPGDDILALPKLKELRGVTWCKFCPNCTVIKPKNLVNESARIEKAEECLHRFDDMRFLEFGQEDPKRFVKNRFVPECMCVKQSECEFRHVVMPYFKKRTSLPQRLFYIEYFLSPFTIIFNLVVLVTILTSRPLSKTPSFILIANIAVVDIMVGVYAVWVSHVNISQIDGILEEIMWTGKELQPSTGPIFIAGQIISVSISLLLTVERYLAVIYCMKPYQRMTAKGAVLALIFSWAVAIAYALMPVFEVGGLRYNIKRACTPLSYDKEFKSESSVILLVSLIIVVVLYLINIPLYIQIFRFVKKTGNQVGVKREASLAKKIAVLVLTNFIFFAIPIILIFIFSILAEFDSNPFDFKGDAFQSTIFKITVGQWLPVTCLNINSLLDPFLYAFKHRNFKRQVRRKIGKCTRKVSPEFSVGFSNNAGDAGSSDSATKAGKLCTVQDND